MGEDEVRRIAEAVAAKLQESSTHSHDGEKCAGMPACCVQCRLSPEEHAEQHRAMKGALKIRSVVVVKIVEYGAVVLFVWLLTRMGFKVPQ